MQLVKNKLTPLVLVAISAVLVLPTFFILMANQRANAASLTTTYIRLNRMTAVTATTFRLQFRTVNAGATTLSINFNGADSTTWTGSSGLVNATQATTTATCATETGDTALPGTLSASGSGSTLSMTGITALAATTTYCVDFTTSNAVTTAAAGEYHPVITVGTDSTTVAVRTITNDQIVVTATVPPTFNFVLSGNTDTFASNLTTSAVSTSGKTVTITTNAAAGWIAWVKNLNGSSGAATKGALKSAAAGNFTIPTTNANALGSASHTLSAGQDYGLGVTITTDAAGGGTVALDAAYDGNSTKIGVLDPTNFRPIATANGTANGDVITLTERAIIDASVPAATDYTDTITVIGAGNF